MGVAVVAIDTFAVREAIDALIQKGRRRYPCIRCYPPVGCTVSARPRRRRPGGFVDWRLRRASGSVGIIAGAMTLCDQADRRVGFEQVITREYPHYGYCRSGGMRDDSSITVTVARELLANNPDLVGYTISGRVTADLSMP
jgi:LacI family transcriptional regulator